MPAATSCGLYPPGERLWRQRRSEPEGAEARRLAAARDAEAAWRKWGPYLSERQWGTVREDYSDVGRRLELLHPRPGALARLSLGRRRPGRHLGRPAAALLRAGAVERPGPDPQGAAVRPDQQRGQPRRGREGVLLLPRLDADALVHEVPLQVSAGGVSLRRPRRDQPASAGAHDFEYELLDTGVFDADRYFDVFVEYAKASPEDILIQITVYNRGPEPATLHVLPTIWFRNIWSWGEAGAAARRCALTDGGDAVVASHPELGERRVLADGAPTWLFTENDTNFERLVGSPEPQPLRQGRHQRLRRARPRRRGEPGEDGHQGRGALSAHRRRRRVADDSPAAHRRRPVRGDRRVSAARARSAAPSTP